MKALIAVLAALAVICASFAMAETADEQEADMMEAVDR